MKLGGGGRFKKLVKNLESKGKSSQSANKIAVSIGRKKYGAKRFAQFSAKGRRGR